MDRLTSTAASGLRTRAESLDLLANNLANAGTQGFKADRESFGLYVSPEATASADRPPNTSPVVERAWTDFAQGTLLSTGNMLDMAISGNGLFAVNGPAGVLYTRNGSFRLNPSGALVTSEGHVVRDTNGKPIQLNASRAIDIDKDGTIKQDGQAIAQLAVLAFKDTAVLQKEGNSYFRNVDAGSQPVRATEVEVHQGKVEGSNVGAAESAMRLVAVLRQFEMLEKAISLGGEMNRKSVEEVARVAV